MQISEAQPRTGESRPMDDVGVPWRVEGSGPPLLAPECNYSWDPDFLATMAQDFSVIVASPRDFGRASRTGGPTYQPDGWAEDMESAVHEAGIERVLMFGYSFTGAFGPWLAQQRPGLVAGVVSGGFPLLGDYGITAEDVRSQLAGLEAEPELFDACYRSRFDPRAGAAFYDELAGLKPDGLVDETPCPLDCFWGDQDTDAVSMVLSHQELTAGLTAHQIPFELITGFDHEGLNDNLGVAWSTARQWLLDHASSTETRWEGTDR